MKILQPFTRRGVVSILVTLLMLALLVCPLLKRADADTTTATPHTFSFNVPSSCTCASCSFEVHRTVKKFEGVFKTALSVRDRRLDVTFDEAKHPLSALANLIAHLDLGKDSALLWPLPPGVDTNKALAALGQVPGVHTAKLDPKTHLAQITFNAAKDDPTVTATQLKDAVNGVAHADH
ncbi:MAG: hypothetical protein JO316_18195 [Abitibacteriaceae bacterium]|nr:hypothetical protein [Abditibacteriaceae bacterium]MBV9867291.1 hypothetical protein [Abditibacteriaceae bacterium]